MVLRCDKDEAMRYLGYRGQEVSEEILRLIDETAGEAERAVLPRFCTVRDRLEKRPDGIYLKNCGLCLSGVSIKKHLEICDNVILFGATLGIEIDKLIRIYETKDMTRAVIMDSCASALIENYCDNICGEMETELRKEGLYMTSRFSPGYGDLPLSVQRELVRALNASRRIGLTLNEQYLMFPRKSVTAVIGLAETKPANCGGYGCEMCSMNKTCPGSRVR